MTFEDLQYRTGGDVRAPVLVMAAGTLGSTRLLLRNRRRLRKLSPALGTRYSGNGDALALALDPQRRRRHGREDGVRPGHDEPHRRALAGEGFMIADGGLPKSFDDVLEVLRGVRLLTGLGRIRVAAKNLATKLGITDHPLVARRHARAAPPADRRLAHLPLHRPRRRRRHDAPHAAVPAL